MQSEFDKVFGDPSTIQVVDYEKEADRVFPYFDGLDRGIIDQRRRIWVDGTKFARQISSPSDTNSKVKELIEFIREKKNKYSIHNPVQKILYSVIEKANSLIQQDKPGE